MNVFHRGYDIIGLDLRKRLTMEEIREKQPEMHGTPECKEAAGQTKTEAEKNVVQSGGNALEIPANHTP
jgi:hypothetical protein